MASNKKPNARLVDMVDQVFGRLTVVSRAETPAHVRSKGAAYWSCRCSCGKSTVTSGKSLRQGGVQSCGCLHLERVKAAATTHGHAKAGAHTRTYNTWQAMRRRCLDAGDDNYFKYGARGISICQQWDSFEQFLSDMGERPEGMTLDRIDVNGNYEPGNCRWATPSQQSANTRRARVYEFNGRSLPLAEWAREVGVSYQTLRTRIDCYGWTPDRALSTPILIERKKNAVVA